MDEDKKPATLELPPDVWQVSARTIAANNHDGTWTVTGLVKALDGDAWAMLYESTDADIAEKFDRWLHPSRNREHSERGTWNTTSEFYQE